MFLKKKLAGLFSKQYKLSGDVQYLLAADSLLKKINQRIPNQVGVLQSLAANAISRHAFRSAEDYIRQAYEIGEKRFVSSLILIDVLLERGKLYDAQQLMQDIASDRHFDYLIRDVKLQDEKGDLEEAIQQMEKALAKAKSSGNEEIVNWSLSNLADMYGHDGRISKSYRTYLRALEKNPADFHSLKGIAWVAFSHDKNTEAAKQILHFLKSAHPVPDYDLMLAEIAAYEGQQESADQHIKAFLAEASRSVYGNMYKGYLCELTAETSNALAIAKTEVEERPHPMSYDLLAWTYFQNGNAPKALELLNGHVLHKTSEPVAIYHAGVILKEGGEYEQAEKYLEEAHDAAYELGPVIAREVARHLEELNLQQLATLYIQDVMDYRPVR